MTDISESLEALLVRQGMKAPGAAMDRARRQLPATGREELSPVHVGGMREAHAYLDELEAAGTEAPALVRWDTAQFEPSPGRRTRPALKLLDGGNRQRPVRYVAGPCLVLIKGGKS